MMLLVIRPAALLALLLAPLAMADDGVSMYRYPDISNDEIVFVYANDLWRVPIDGGTALPLASPEGVELTPRFSPDGEHVAFVGNYDGGRDLYTVPTAGGIPTRITHHPATELLSDWTTGGELLFSASGTSGVPRAERAFRVSKDGGLPEAFPIPYGANATLNRDGTMLAYTPWQRDRRTWKRYKGGLASDVWLLDLASGESTQVTTWDGTDTLPMWHGSTLYYLSDEGDEHRLNLWKYNTKTGKRSQLTRFKEYDVKWPAIGPDDDGAAMIVFQYGAGLWVYNARINATTPISIDIPGAEAAIRPHMVDASEFITSWGVSPSAKRAVVSARGDIWTLPAKNGSPRNLTRTSGVAERMPTWSPDGKWIAYASDATGEYEVYRRPSDGSGEGEQLTSDGGPFKMSIAWLPNSEAILYTIKTGDAVLLDLESGEETTVFTDVWNFGFDPAFSHDSKWITWAAGDEASPRGRVYLYDIDAGDLHIVTDSMFDDQSPTFGRDGEWLYFTSFRTFRPSYSDVDSTWIYDDGGVMMAVPLRDDVEYPWIAKSDEESFDEDDAEEDTEEEEEEEEEEKTEPAASPADPVTGVWDCIAEIPQMGPLEIELDLVLNADDFVTGSMTSMMGDGEINGTWDGDAKMIELDLAIEDGPTIAIEGTIEDGQFEGTASPDGMPKAMLTGTRRSANADANDDDEKDSDDEDVASFEIAVEGFERRAIMLPVQPGSFKSLVVNSKNQLMYVRSGSGIKVFDLSDEDAKESSAGSGGGFLLSANGKKILVPSGGSAVIRSAGTGSGGDRVVTEPMLQTINPREEWRQLLTDAWRIQRDFFYDEHMHGVDWEAVLAAYRPLVDQASTREDVSYLIGEMISELNVGHAYYYGGDGEDAPSMNVGMLGVDWVLDDTGDEPVYRIGRIIEGGAWDADARNPLNHLGDQIKEGDVVLAVNGVPMDPHVDPYAPFVGYAGRTVVLTVADEPGEEPRDVAVKTMRSERAVRYRDWIESRRKIVDEATNGTVGYIYVPNTGRDGQSDLVRQFHGQAHKGALIIDERWNGGGQIPDRFIELLNRPITNFWARRDGKDWKWPPDSHTGPKAMLINGHAGSGGDMFPWLFKHNNLGPVIGTRTWGGLVGISGNPGLIDGGYTAVPTFGFYEADGTWGIEGHGVDPDIEVVDDPALMLNGEDPQLAKAIEVMLEALANGEGFTPPARPMSPDRSGIGITDEDK